MFIALCSDSFVYDAVVNGEKHKLTFSATTLGDLADFVRYYKYLTYHELKAVVADLPKLEQSALLKEEFKACSNKRAKVKEGFPAPIEKGDDGLPLPGQDMTKQVFVESEKQFSFECPEVLEFSESIEGLIYTLYLSLQHKHEDITLDFVRAFLPEDRLKIETLLLELNGITLDNIDKDMSKKKIT